MSPEQMKRRVSENKNMPGISSFFQFGNQPLPLFIVPVCVVQKQQKCSVFSERGVFGSPRREKVMASRRAADLWGNGCQQCIGFLKVFGGIRSAFDQVPGGNDQIRSLLGGKFQQWAERGIPHRHITRIIRYMRIIC